MADKTQPFDQFLIQMDFTHDPPTPADWITIEAHYTYKSTEDLFLVLSYREHLDTKSARMVCSVINKLLRERGTPNAFAVPDSRCVIL